MGKQRTEGVVIGLTKVYLEKKCTGTFTADSELKW